jgi:hypothetical protein
LVFEANFGGWSEATLEATLASVTLSAPIIPNQRSSLLKPALYALLVRVQWADANMLPGLTLLFPGLGRLKLPLRRNFLGIPTLLKSMSPQSGCNAEYANLCPMF